MPRRAPAGSHAERLTGSAGSGELGCSRNRVYEALHAAGIEMSTNGYYPKLPRQIPPEVAERAVSLYLAGSAVKAVAAEPGLKVQHVCRLVEERTLSDGSSVKRSRREAARRAASGPGAAPPNEWPASWRRRCSSVMRRASLA
jgi:hypothetical protein